MLSKWSIKHTRIVFAVNFAHIQFNGLAFLDITPNVYAVGLGDVSSKLKANRTVFNCCALL